MVMVRRARSFRPGKGQGPSVNQPKKENVPLRHEKRGWTSTTPTSAKWREPVKSFTAEEARGTLDLWNRIEPVTLKGAADREYPVTYSNDSEISFRDAYRTVLEDPAALGTLAATFPPEPMGRWLEIFGTATRPMSETQFRQFALRKGVDRTNNEYRATDLTPVSFERFLTQGKQYGEAMKGERGTALVEANYLLPSLIEPILRRKGYPVRVDAEPTGGVEIKHERFETSPKAYADYIGRLHKDFDTANTQPHVGLPADAVSVEQGTLIAAITEAGATLGLASMSDVPGHRLSFNWGSPLAGRIRQKGPVRFTANRFETPVRAHDVELRQWNSIEHGLELMQSAVVLGQNVSRLRTFKGRTFGGETNDPYLGNIGGALELSGVTLMASKTPARRRVGIELVKMGQRATRETAADVDEGISQSLRTEIYKYLNKNNVPSLLNPQAFLVSDKG